MSVETHDRRVATEIERYRHVENIHDLPDIFHYWSNKFLGPHLAEIFAEIGASNMHEVFATELRASIQGGSSRRVLSIGAGDAGVEIVLARRLLDAGFGDFQFHCVELSPHLVARANAAVAAAGLSAHIQCEVADLSTWRARDLYGAAFAHHSLHHIEALEHVFDQVRDHLEPQASFVIADMIGRNGHMRWPEVLAPLERLWTVIPRRYKYHHLFAREVDPFLNWDCSGEGFEGIRAQDIMPALIDRFHFRRICAWGGVLDNFIDRGYGHNLDRDNPEDTAFIDRLWALDCALLEARAATPTQIIAVLTKEPGPLERSSFGLTPAECVRLP